MKIPVTVPDCIEPMKGRAYEWLNQSGPIDLTLEPMYITWVKSAGEKVEKGETILEGEVQKRIVPVTAPCSGTLIEIVRDDSWAGSAGEILGYIENGE